MNKQQEALNLVLEAMQECRRDPRLKYEHPYYDKTIAAIREALAEQPEQPFNPDWSLLEATQESLREHMATLHKLKAALKLALESLK